MCVCARLKSDGANKLHITANTSVEHVGHFSTKSMCAVQLCAGQQTEKQQDIQSKETESKQTSRRHWVSQPLKWHHSQGTCKHSETGYALKGEKKTFYDYHVPRVSAISVCRATWGSSLRAALREMKHLSWGAVCLRLKMCRAPTETVFMQANGVRGLVYPGWRLFCLTISQKTHLFYVHCLAGMTSHMSFRYFRIYFVKYMLMDEVENTSC